MARCSAPCAEYSSVKIVLRGAGAWACRRIRVPLAGSAFYHGTGVASDEVDTETYKAFNRAVCEAVRRIKPMSVYEATSRRPISTNMVAKAGSRKRSEMRVAR